MKPELLLKRGISDVVIAALFSGLVECIKTKDFLKSINLFCSDQQAVIGFFRRLY